MCVCVHADRGTTLWLSDVFLMELCVTEAADPSGCETFTLTAFVDDNASVGKNSSVVLSCNFHTHISQDSLQ